MHQRLLDKAQQQDTNVILKGMCITGNLQGGTDVFLYGDFEGTMQIDALLFIGKTGRLKGEVTALNIVIEGEADGTLIAREKVVLHDTGKYTGDIIAPSVMISDKATFDGQLKMDLSGRKAQSLIFTEKRKPRDASQAIGKDMPESDVEVTVVEDPLNLNARLADTLNKFKSH